MSEYEQIFHKQELYDLYTKGEIVPLEDLYGIEDVGLNVKEMSKKIEFLKEYKKRKRSDIDKEINILENKIDFFKKIVIATLKDKKEKGVDFPGSCKVVSRNNKPNWSISDEEEFVRIIKEAEEEGEKVNGVIEEVISFNIKKKDANKLLDIWEKNGNFEKYFDTEEKPCVNKEPARITVSFKYPEKEEDEEIIDETAIPMKEEEIEEVNNNDFDEI